MVFNDRRALEASRDQLGTESFVNSVSDCFWPDAVLGVAQSRAGLGWAGLGFLHLAMRRRPASNIWATPKGCTPAIDE